MAYKVLVKTWAWLYSDLPIEENRQINKQSDNNKPWLIVFFFLLWLHNHNQRRIRGWKIQGAHCWVSKAELSLRHIPRTVPSWETDWIPYSIGIRNEVTVKLHSNKAYPKQWTFLAVKVGSPKRPLQLLQTVSSSVSFSTFPKQSCSILNIVFMSEMQSKNSILQINVVQCVYVELCYKTFTSTYKKSNYDIDISNVSDLTFDGMCFFPEKWSRWHSAKRTNNL